MGPSNNAVAGDVFLSFGSSNSTPSPVIIGTSASGGANNVAGQIFLGSNQTWTVIPTGSTPVTFSGASDVYSGTITVNSGGANISLNGYSGIGTSASTVALQIDFGGDSRLLVPIVSTQGVFASSVVADNTVPGGTLPYQLNGYNLNLIDVGSGIVLSGNTTSNPQAGGQIGNVAMYEFGAGQTIGQTLNAGVSTGSISANNLTLVASLAVGDTGVSGSLSYSPIATSASTLTAQTLLSGRSNNSFININPTAPITLVGVNQVVGTAGGSVSPSEFDVFGPSLTVAPGSVVMAPDVVLQLNASTFGTSGTINGQVIGAGGVFSTSAQIFPTVGLQYSSLTVGTTGSITSVGPLYLGTHQFGNSGVVQALLGNLAIDNEDATNSKLTLSNTGSILAPIALTLSSVGDIDFGGLIQGGALNLLPGANLVMIAGGNITATGGTPFSINTSGPGAGGQVTMIAGVQYGFVPNTWNTLQLGSPVTLSGTGGSIILDGSSSSDPMSSIITSSSSSAGGNVTLIAQGLAANNPLVLLPTSGTISTGGLTQNGSVQAYSSGSSSAGQTVVQVGTINTAGAGTGGLIQLLTATIGGTQEISLPNGATTPTTPVQGGTGTISVQQVITNGASLQVSTGNGSINLGPSFGTNLDATSLVLTSTGAINLQTSTISVVPSAAGNGGTIELVGSSITWPGGPSTPLILSANGTNGGSGGTIAVNILGSTDVTIGSTGASNNIEMSALPSATGGAGGSLSLATLGTISFNGTAFTAAPAPGTNGNGPALSLSGSTVTENVGGSALALNANGAGTGSGGSISISESGAINVTSANFQLSATSGTAGGNGGSITLNSGGNITVGSPSPLNVNPLGKNGNGGSLTLDAGTGGGTGDLQVTGANYAERASAPVMVAALRWTAMTRLMHSL